MKRATRLSPTPPKSPLDAVTDADPFAYYADLVDRHPFYFDAECGFWVATSAAAVRQVLLDPACRVRPIDEPVPRAIEGSAAGDVFGNLVRMLDGPRHDRLKELIARALVGCDLQRAGQLAAAATRTILRRGRHVPFDAIMYDMPARVVALLGGMPDEPSWEAGRLIGAFAKCITGLAGPEQLGAAVNAVERLTELVSAATASPGAGLTVEMMHGAEPGAGVRDTPFIANAIGLLSQTYDATAGLIGNTLVALAHHVEARLAARTDLERVVREVLRYDSPVQNTRRYAAQPVTILDVAVPKGAAILVVLAAASRDPVVNARPHQFDPYRADPTLFAFGAGAHRCPGEELAVTIATAAVSTLLETGFDPTRIHLEISYRPSASTRIPLLQAA